jgi:outer membrane protein assembly factor BamB
MFRKILLPVLLSVIVYCGCSKKSNNPGGGGGNPPANPIDTNTGKPNNEHISVLTQHNDNTRAGLNNKETVLTTSNVNTAQFGRLFTLTVDDQVYAQPLVYAGLSIASGTHNVVFIATVNNSVYAYDGDKGKLYWSKNYTESGMRPPLGSDMNSNWCNPYTDFTSSIGIAGTPVIDSVSKTMYFVARSTNGATFEQYLHAIDITTGAEHAGSPVKIQASVPGTGDGSSNGVVSFDPRRNNQRRGWCWLMV